MGSEMCIRDRPKGAGAKRPPSWGAAEGGALLFSIFGRIFVADALFMLLIFHWATGLFAGVGVAAATPGKLQEFL